MTVLQTANSCPLHCNFSLPCSAEVDSALSPTGGGDGDDEGGGRPWDDAFNPGSDLAKLKPQRLISEVIGNVENLTGIGEQRCRRGSYSTQLIIGPT